MSVNQELDRLTETGFELELGIEENRLHNVYKLFTKSIVADIDIDFPFEYEIRKKYKWSVIYHMPRDEIYNVILTQGKDKNKL